MNHPELAQVKMSNGLYLYDVCSDYSLCKNVSERSAKVAESKKYIWTPGHINGNACEFGHHKDHKELHYVRSSSDRLNSQRA